MTTIKKNCEIQLIDKETDQTGNIQNTDKISLFKNNEEMMRFYLLLAKLFCPTVFRYPEGKMHLVIYKYKLKRLSQCINKVLNFPWNEDISILQIGVGNALMDQSISKKDRQHLLKRWSKAIEYTKEMSEYLVMLKAFTCVLSDQKHDIQKLLEQFHVDPQEEALIRELGENTKEDTTES